MKYCHNCGAPVTEAYRFCAQCGQILLAPAAPAAAVPVPSHQRHVRLLAILLLVWGGLGLLAGMGMLWAGGMVVSYAGHMAGHVVPAQLLPALLSSLGWIFLAISVAAVIAGVGLLDYESWARPLAMVVCVLALLRFPFGTILGIYGLWVLVSATGERHYQQMAARRG